MLGWTCQRHSGAPYFNFLYNRSPLWGRGVRVETPRTHSFSSVVITDPHVILQLCRWHSSGGGGRVGSSRGWNSNEVWVSRVSPKPWLCCGQSRWGGGCLRRGLVSDTPVSPWRNSMPPQPQKEYILKNLFHFGHHILGGCHSQTIIWQYCSGNND